MSTAEIKSDLHEMIQELQNEDLLYALHDLLSSRKRPAGELWRDLSSEQRAEVMDAWEESNDPVKLTDHEDFLKKFQ